MKNLLLQMEAICKTFPGVNALNKVNLNLDYGKVLALVGENGAGKSTLMKILGGAIQPNSGKIKIEGEIKKIFNPQISQKNGVSIIYQEFNLIKDLKVHENIFLGREITKNGFVDTKLEKKLSINQFDNLGVNIDPDIACNKLSIAEQQIVEIAKALTLDSKIIVMDEPSAVLTEKEVKNLMRIINDLVKKNIGIIYISHRLDEIIQISDNILILRDGFHVNHFETKRITKKQLIENMVGKSLSIDFPKRKSIIKEEVLRVESFSKKNFFSDINFKVNQGEVLGFAGLLGSGRTAIMRSIYGADKFDSGKIYKNNQELNIKNPIDGIKNKICLLTEDRKKEGLILNHSSQKNFGLPNLKNFSKNLIMNESKEIKSFKNYINDIKIKIDSPKQIAKNLSGGNQQKLVLAKWLESNADIIIFDEPTRGIDVAGKREIYELINDLSFEGKSILFVSSDLEEIIGMSDKIIVIHEGRIKGSLKVDKKLTQENILSIALG
ncbi:MAG: D-xylose ABC transporter ATP-binding protein [Flavobacteriales bacterium]|nr:D-xylose ABC transporter ATP-binding protein [Flavobacteriales bacterium]